MGKNQSAQISSEYREANHTGHSDEAPEPEFRIPAWIFQIKGRDGITVEGNTKIILAVLHSRASHKQICNPGIRSMYKDTGMTKATIAMQIKKLILLDYIRVIPGTRYRSAIYILPIDQGNGNYFFNWMAITATLRNLKVSAKAFRDSNPELFDFARKQIQQRDYNPKVNSYYGIVKGKEIQLPGTARKDSEAPRKQRAV